MSLVINSGRQNKVVAEQRVKFSDLVSGVALAALYLPPGAHSITGSVIPLTPFNSATTDTLDVGTQGTGAAYGNDLDIAASAALPLSGLPPVLTDGEWVYVNWTGTGAAPSEGEFLLTVEYAVLDRSQYDIGVNRAP